MFFNAPEITRDSTPFSIFSKILKPLKISINIIHLITKKEGVFVTLPDFEQHLTLLEPTELSSNMKDSTVILLT